MRTFEEIEKPEVYSQIEEELRGNAEKIGSIGVAIQELNRRLERVLKPDNMVAQDNEEMKIKEPITSMIAEELRRHNRELYEVYESVVSILDRLDL